MKAVPMAAVPPDLLRRIRIDAAAHFKLIMEPVATAAWRIQTPYSRVLCIQLASAGWQQRVFAKLPRNALDPSSLLPAMMGKEFEILRALAAPDLSPAGAGTVEPLAHYADIPSLVTVEAPGVTLSKEYNHHARVISSGRARAALAQRVALCGQWLRYFHERTAAGVSGFDLEELVTYLQIRLNRLRQVTPPVLTAQEADGLLQAATRIARAIADDSLKVAGRHNDFASHNIIAGRDGGIRVLDFTMFDHGGHAFDVCNFWFELEMLKCDPGYSRELLSNLQATFLRSYGDMSPDVDAPDFLLARLRYTLNRLLNVLDNRRLVRWISPNWHRTLQVTKQWLRDFATQFR